MAEQQKLPETFDVMKSITGGKGGFPFAFDQQRMESWTRGMTACAEEMTRFVQARWQTDVDAWTKLAACREPTEAIACQQRYAEKTLTDYADEFAKLSRLMMDASTQGLSAFQSQPSPASAPKTAKAV